METFLGFIQTILLIIGIIMFWNVCPWWSIVNLLLLIFTVGWAIGVTFNKKGK